jgi:hypothetical protein
VWPETFAGRSSPATAHFGKRYGMVAQPMRAGLTAQLTDELRMARAIAAELGDITRFANPRQLMAYLGLVPSEHCSGGTRRQGGITMAATARRGGC